MTTLSALISRGAGERDELVEVYRDRKTGRLRAELWGPDGSQAHAKGEEHVGIYCGPVVCVPLGWGRWEVAEEEVPPGGDHPAAGSGFAPGQDSPRGLGAVRRRALGRRDGTECPA